MVEVIVRPVEENMLLLICYTKQFSEKVWPEARRSKKETENQRWKDRMNDWMSEWGAEEKRCDYEINWKDAILPHISSLLSLRYFYLFAKLLWTLFAPSSSSLSSSFYCRLFVPLWINLWCVPRIWVFISSIFRRFFFSSSFLSV